MLDDMSLLVFFFFIYIYIFWHVLRGESFITRCVYGDGGGGTFRDHFFCDLLGRGRVNLGAQDRMRGHIIC